MASPLSPRAVNPPTGEAWFYEKKNFGGSQWKVKGSAANLKHLHPGSDDNISSIRIGPDTVVEAFTEHGYKGKSTRFEGEVGYVGDAFHKKISSVRVFHKDKDPSSPRVEHKN